MQSTGKNDIFDQRLYLHVCQNKQLVLCENLIIGKCSSSCINQGMQQLRQFAVGKVYSPVFPMFKREH